MPCRKWVHKLGYTVWLCSLHHTHSEQIMVLDASLSVLLFSLHVEFSLFVVVDDVIIHIINGILESLYSGVSSVRKKSLFVTWRCYICRIHSTAQTTIYRTTPKYTTFAVDKVIGCEYYWNFEIVNLVVYAFYSPASILRPCSNQKKLLHSTKISWSSLVNQAYILYSACINQEVFAFRLK